MTETCICHGPLLRAFGKAVPPDLREMWSRCPCRGMMVSWYATGECFGLLASMSEKAQAQLSVELPSDASKYREVLLAEFERARAHLLTIVTMKNTYFTQPPFCLFGIAHPRRDVARESWEHCMSLDVDHPRWRTLQSDEMRAQASRFFYDQVLLLIGLIG